MKDKPNPCLTFAILIQVESHDKNLLRTCYSAVKTAVDRKVEELLRTPEVKRDNTLFTQRYSAIRPVEKRCAGCGAPAMRNGRPLCGCITQATYTPKPQPKKS